MIPIENSTVDSSSRIPAPLVDNLFCPPMWDLPIKGHSLGYCEANARDDPAVKGNMFLPSVSGMASLQSLPHSSDSGFIERASCFGSVNIAEVANPFSPYSHGKEFIRAPMQLQMNEMDVNEVSKEASKNDKTNEKKLDYESEEAEFSGQCVQEESSNKGFSSKKRKRGTQGGAKSNESDEAPELSIEMGKDNAKIKPKGVKKGTSSSKNGGKNVEGSQGSDPPKEEYMHIRARRGQATNSHSLAERVRREKISERMTFLQDLVPGCSKVTGKAVMLDEIINYVQSLQRQVEFLSMKLATVNPSLEFNIEGLLANVLQHRGSVSPSLAFPSEMTMPFPSLHHLAPPGVILANNLSESHRRPVNLQSIAGCNGFNEPTSQVLSEWEDELHNIVHMGVNSSAPLHSQDFIGSLPPNTEDEP